MNKLEKFFNLVKKHLLISLAIVLGTVAVIMTGVSFLTSYLNYVQYSENYEKTKKDLLANTPQLPEEVIKDNEYVVYDDAAGTVGAQQRQRQQRRLTGTGRCHDDGCMAVAQGTGKAVGNSRGWKVGRGEHTRHHVGEF